MVTAVGAWDSMRAARVAPFYNMEVWDATGPGAIHFDNGTEKLQPGEEGTELGYMIENRVMQAALHHRLRSMENVTMFCPSSVKSMQLGQQEEDWVAVKLEGDKELRTRLVVGADGGNSLVRQAGNIPTSGWAYNQKAVVAVVEHKEANTTAWQRFLPYGPLAVLPVCIFCVVCVHYTGRCSISSVILCGAQHRVEQINWQPFRKINSSKS